MDKAGSVADVPEVTVTPHAGWKSRDFQGCAKTRGKSAMPYQWDSISGSTVGRVSNVVETGGRRVERQPSCPAPSAKLAAGSSRRPGVARLEAGASGVIVFPGG